MERFEGVTLEEAYQKAKKCGYVVWTTKGNFLDSTITVNGENFRTIVFLSENLFILGLSVEVEKAEILASEVDNIDTWPTMKEKYPQLTNSEVKGEARVFP